MDKETVGKLIDISLLLLDRVVEAKGDLHMAEYEELERKVRAEYSDDGEWLLHLTIAVIRDDRLFGRYREIEPMIAKLNPRGYPPGTAAYLLIVRPELHKLIYAVIRHVDDAEENLSFAGLYVLCRRAYKRMGRGLGLVKGREW